MNIFNVIIAPVFSEKATAAAEAAKYTYKVDKRACKQDVKQAIEKLFSVKVEKVNIVNCKSKVRVFKGVKGVKSGYKKAIVTLQKGQIIEIGKGV